MIIYPAPGNRSGFHQKKKTESKNKMKTNCKALPYIIALVAFIAALSIPPTVHAADYDVIKTFVASGTNRLVDAASTNLDAVADLTQWTEFQLEVQAGNSNAVTGSLDIRWDTSNDGSKFPTHLALANNSGWFAVPLTNNGTAAIWHSNISVGALGYWRIEYITNNLGGFSSTGLTVRAYAKPKNTSLR